MGTLEKGRRAKCPLSAAYWLVKGWFVVGVEWRVRERREIVWELELAQWLPGWLFRIGGPRPGPRSQGARLGWNIHSLF